MTERARRFAATEDGHLSPDMQRAWAEDGFLILEDFVPAAACDALKAHCQQLVADFDPGSVASIFSASDQSHGADRYFQDSGDKIRFFFEPEAFDAAGQLRQAKALSINKLGHAMHDLDPAFDRFSRTAKLARLAQDLGLQQPQLLQSMYIFKQPHIGGEVTCHQDSSFLYTEPLSCIGFWFAIEDATEENGAMFAIPGAHRGPLTRRYRYQGADLGFQQLAQVDWPERKVLLDARKGSLVLLHGSVPHLSGANRSSRSRHAYTLHVIDGAAHYPADNWLRRPGLPLRGFSDHV